MPVFVKNDPESWLFRAERYFQIHKLTESEKMKVSIISFDRATLDWYRSHEDRDLFVNWEDLKRRLIVQFRSGREGSILGRILTIKQETTMKEYRNLFDKLVVPLPFLQKAIIEETFTNGLKPWIKAEMECWEPVGLAQMMKLAQKIKNRESEGTIPIRTITLREVAAETNCREGPSRQLSDVEFQVRCEKGLCFRCEEKFYACHRCEVKDQKELRLLELRVLIVQANGEELEVVEEDVYSEEPEETSHYGVILRSGTAVKGGRSGCHPWKQWLHTLGVTEVGWWELTLTFVQNEKKVVIRGDPSLTKTKVSLKHIMKTWTPSDQGFLIECRFLEGGMTFAELYGIDDVPTIQESILTAIAKFEDVYDWPQEYAYQQKEEMERLVNEMLASGIIRPSTSPYSSSVLLPADIFGYHKNPATKEWEVLISWQGLPPHEATWENYADFAQQFPHFHLEDKVSLEGGVMIDHQLFYNIV
ncbi:transposon Tf2-1 polyprotein isoform X1 [Cucumis melo var. makuwa]|uniref:Transposon Tf2-1 polyprotein isoform X1 n=1 Tax=Cucumis melo var. makuwa TaxID=1194695 RepID=A0A5D3CR50_CUCMM|nr:transposon Tf2-1 polyprotein isoform X1 [Cucumis melo var. makuwa]